METDIDPLSIQKHMAQCAAALSLEEKNGKSGGNNGQLCSVPCGCACVCQSLCELVARFHYKLDQFIVLGFVMTAVP